MMQTLHLAQMSMASESDAKSSHGEGSIYNDRLKNDIGMILSVCLQELVEVQPRDPIYYIAQWLYKYADNKKYFESKTSHYEVIGTKVSEMRRARLMQRKKGEKRMSEMMYLQNLLPHEKTEQAITPEPFMKTGSFERYVKKGKARLSKIHKLSAVLQRMKVSAAKSTSKHGKSKLGAIASEKFHEDGESRLSYSSSYGSEYSPSRTFSSGSSGTQAWSEEDRSSGGSGGRRRHGHASKRYHDKHPGKSSRSKYDSSRRGKRSIEPDSNEEPWMGRGYKSGFRADQKGSDRDFQADQTGEHRRRGPKAHRGGRDDVYGSLSNLKKYNRLDREDAAPRDGRDGRDRAYRYKHRSSDSDYRDGRQHQRQHPDDEYDKDGQKSYRKHRSSDLDPDSYKDDRYSRRRRHDDEYDDRDRSYRRRGDRDQDSYKDDRYYRRRHDRDDEYDDRDKSYRRRGDRDQDSYKDDRYHRRHDRDDEYDDRDKSYRRRGDRDPDSYKDDRYHRRHDRDDEYDERDKPYRRRGRQDRDDEYDDIDKAYRGGRSARPDFDKDRDGRQGRRDRYDSDWDDDRYDRGPGRRRSYDEYDERDRRHRGRASEYPDSEEGDDDRRHRRRRYDDERDERGRPYRRRGDDEREWELDDERGGRGYYRSRRGDDDDRDEYERDGTRRVRYEHGKGMTRSDSAYTYEDLSPPSDEDIGLYGTPSRRRMLRKKSMKPHRFARKASRGMCTWALSGSPPILTCYHQILGKLQSPHRIRVAVERADLFWGPARDACEVLYDQEIYTVCDPHADDELYEDRMAEWTGRTWKLSKHNFSPSSTKVEEEKDT